MGFIRNMKMYKPDFSQTESRKIFRYPSKKRYSLVEISDILSAACGILISMVLSRTPLQTVPYCGSIYKLENKDIIRLLYYYIIGHQGRIQPGCTGCTCTPLVSEYMFIVCSMLEALWMFRQQNQGCTHFKLQKLRCTLVNFKLQNFNFRIPPRM